MSKKTSYGTNSWWAHRMVGSYNPNKDIRTWEDKKQDDYLQKLEEASKKKKKK